MGEGCEIPGEVNILWEEPNQLTFHGVESGLAGGPRKIPPSLSHTNGPLKHLTFLWHTI